MNSRDLPQVDLQAPGDPHGIGTIGLHESLRLIANWAAKLGLDSIFVATLDASKTDVHTYYVGTVLRFLSEPDPSNFLSAWAEELPCAKELSRLSEACSVSPFIAAKYPGMPHLKPVATQLTGGQLSELPTVALVTPPVPAGAENDRQWISALRTWVFVQNVDAVFRGGWQNRYLIEVTNKLRLAIDQDPQWLDLFIRLRGPTRSFHGLTRHLTSACSDLLNMGTNPIEKSGHRRLLSELKNFCSGKATHDDGMDPTEKHGLFLAYQAQKPQKSGFDTLKTLPLQPGDTLADLDDRVGTAINFDASDSEESVLDVVNIDETRSPHEQDIRSSGIILATAEDHQFLPYSWNRPSPTERNHLEQWVSTALQGDDFTLQTLASFVEIAIPSANSLATVLQLCLSNVTQADWSCDISQGCLHRLPPRRHNGWQIKPDAASWVESLAEISRIDLSPAVTNTLQKLLASRPESTQLGHLWPASALKNPDVMFNEVCRSTRGLERLRSGMLTNVLKQHVFECTHDPVLSELLASHPRTGLGGACAYSSYQHAQVRMSLSRTPADIAGSQTDSVDPRSNAAGSQLSPLDAALRQACLEALDKVSQLAGQPKRWADHHNALTAYVVVVLLAATGGRPVTSPFDSLENFDWTTHALYIEDKVSSRLHQGRLVPIPDWVCSLIKDCYLPHLGRLAVLLSEIDTPLSREVTKLSQGIQSKLLPLFFLLGTQPQLRWLEVSETSLSALDVFSWPLPWNLMRHRLPTMLKRAGLDHEIINGITGHSEQGTAPYGPYSMRIWQIDTDQIRQPLTDSLSALQLQKPAAAPWQATPIALGAGSPTPSCLRPDAQFGSTARSARRQAGHNKAAQQANDEISLFVGARPIDSLSAADWETLSLKMLLHDDGRPRTLGTIRYQTLQNWVTRSWNRNGVRPRIKQRYLPSLEEKSPFTIDAIGCLGRTDAALVIAHQVAESLTPSRTSRRVALALGSLLLMLESHIAEPEVLKDVLQDKNFRLVVFQNCHHMEHSPGLDKVQSAPVRRYAISPTTAILLARAKVGVHQLDIRQWHGTDQMRSILAPLGLNVEPPQSFEASVLLVAAQIQQTNARRYPGLVAAYLNGEIVSAGLGHADWVRVTLGKALPSVLPNLPESHAKNNTPQEDAEDVEDEKGGKGKGGDQDDEDYEDTLPSKQMDATYVAWPAAFMDPGSGNTPDPSSLAQAQKNSFDFFRKIRNALNAEKDSKTPSRRDLDSKLRALISEHQGKVSRSCRLLGEWQRSLLWRKTKEGLLHIRSMERYLNALSVCFRAMAYDHDLLECDEEDVTEFYRRVMEVRQSVRPEHLPDTDYSPPEAKADEEISDDDNMAKQYRTMRLALQLLRDFHRLVSREFGVEDPDWSEICITDELLSISPGVMTEAEYHCALHILAPSPAQASREQLARAFIVLAAYRFGLRGAEITGLLRSDWIDAQAHAVVMLVRNNPIRSLKTPAAQRQIPLLFELTQYEIDIISSWLASWEGISTLNGAGALFAQQQSPSELMNGKLLRRQVSEVIKQVTGNSDLSLHHARHAFANQVALLLLSGASDIWPHAATPEQSPERRSHVRRVLLTTDQVTRRSLWALARLMGHAHPQTTVQSYLHLLPELTMKYVMLAAPKKPPVSQHLSSICINLDKLALREDYLDSTPRLFEVQRAPEMTADQALHFLHLCQRGVDVKRAQLATSLTQENAESLILGIQQIDKIFARRPAINRPAQGPFNLLGHIPQGRWGELIARAHKVRWKAQSPDVSDLHLDELPMMIGCSRQILLWKPSHFTLFKTIADRWSLGEDSYLIHSTRQGRDTLQEMASQANLRLVSTGKVAPDATTQATLLQSSTTQSPPEKSFQQIDPMQIGYPPLLVRYRCAVLPQTHAQSALRSSHELVLIVLVSLALQGQKCARLTT